MRIFAFILTFFSLSAFGEIDFKAADFGFRKNAPIYVFDFPKAGSSTGKIRVCAARVKSLKSSRAGLRVAVPEDDSTCTKMESFETTEKAYITIAALEGRSALSNLRGTEEERVKIKGKVWLLSDRAKVIVARVGTPADGQNELTYVCALQISPLDRVYEEDAPTKSLFCKPIKSITVQAIDLQGNLSFDHLHNPKMIDTAVCPLPRNCVKPEWEITPTMRIMPETDQTTGHAGANDSAEVHREAP